MLTLSKRLRCCEDLINDFVLQRLRGQLLTKCIIYGRILCWAKELKDGRYRRCLLVVRNCSEKGVYERESTALERYEYSPW
jgi:hypothetical protein